MIIRLKQSLSFLFRQRFQQSFIGIHRLGIGMVQAFAHIGNRPLPDCYKGIERK